MFDLESLTIKKEATVLFCYGLGSGEIYNLIEPWIDDSKRVICIEDDDNQMSYEREHAQVEVHFLETPLGMKPLLKKLLWDTVFLECDFICLKDSPHFEEEARHLSEGIHFTMSDYADYGLSIFSNLFQNAKAHTKISLLKDLKNQFKGIPAYVVGAGPSLKEEILKLKNSGALIFAGGSALNALSHANVKPHFAATIDKDAPFSTFKFSDVSEVPFFYQMRALSENISSVHSSSMILAPSSGGYPLEEWVMKELGISSQPIDAGWNVATFLTKVAHYLGCYPINLVGVDLASDQERSYADGTNMLENKEMSIVVKNRQGHDVLTQRDWLFSAAWYREFNVKYPGVLYQTSSSGIDLGFKSIDMKSHQKIDNLDDHILAVLTQLPKYEINQQQPLLLLKKSLLFIDLLLKDKLADFEDHYEEKTLPEEYLSDFEGELFYDKHLTYMWEIFRPVFKRELKFKDKSVEETLHKLLFYSQITQEFIQKLA